MWQRSLSEIVFKTLLPRRMQLDSLDKNVRMRNCLAAATPASSAAATASAGAAAAERKYHRYRSTIRQFLISIGF